MPELDFDPSCPECSKRYVDAGDELVCPSCGRAEDKEAAQGKAEPGAQVPLTSKAALGSYMGSRSMTPEERRSRGIGGSGSRYEYLKAMSDYAGRNEGAPGACAKLIERIGEKLLLPRVVCLEAVAISRRVLAIPRPHQRVTTSSVSAYSLVAACKLGGVTSVSIREIVDAHAFLGRTVTSSSIIQLALESPVRTYARSPEDYLTKVIARLLMNQRLQVRLTREGVGQTPYANSLRRAAVELLRLVSPEARAGRRPSALAASAAYSAELVLSRCEMRKRRVTQREVAECADSAEYTIREQCACIFSPLVDELVRRRTQPLLLTEAR
jgi:transcription initiation factor TFIIIB Brf1 subunit/transcription initiation factor TFIIB